MYFFLAYKNPIIKPIAPENSLNLDNPNKARSISNIIPIPIQQKKPS